MTGLTLGNWRTAVVLKSGDYTSIVISYTLSGCMVVVVILAARRAKVSGNEVFRYANHRVRINGKAVWFDSNEM